MVTVFVNTVVVVCVCVRACARVCVFMCVCVCTHVSVHNEIIHPLLQNDANSKRQATEHFDLLVQLVCSWVRCWKACALTNPGFFLNGNFL